MAASQPKKKAQSGQRNDARPNGKAWKKGKDPKTREAEARQGRDPKRSREKAQIKEAHRARRENEYNLRREEEAIKATAKAKREAREKDDEAKLRKANRANKDIHAALYL